MRYAIFTRHKQSHEARRGPFEYETWEACQVACDTLNQQEPHSEHMPVPEYPEGPIRKAIERLDAQAERKGEG